MNKKKKKKKKGDKTNVSPSILETYFTNILPDYQSISQKNTPDLYLLVHLCTSFL